MRAATFTVAATLGVGVFLVVAATLGVGTAAAGLGSLAIVGAVAVLYVMGDSTLPHTAGGDQALDL